MSLDGKIENGLVKHTPDDAQSETFQQKPKLSVVRERVAALDKIGNEPDPDVGKADKIRAAERADKITRIQSLSGVIELARSIGIEMPLAVSPNPDSPDFEDEFHRVQSEAVGAMTDYYLKFGKRLALDSDMKELIEKYKTAKRSESQSTHMPFKFFSQLGRLGSRAAADEPETSVNLGKQIVNLTCKKFYDAKINKMNIFAPVTLENTNLNRVERLLGISFQ